MLPKRRHKKGRKLRGIPKTVTITKMIIIISKIFGNLNNNNNNKHDNDNNNIAGYPNNKNNNKTNNKNNNFAGHPNNNINNKNNNSNNNIAGYPNNKEFKMPSGGQVSDSFLLSLRPRTFY